MNFNWNKPGVIQTLKDMWAAGFSTKEITKDLNHPGDPSAISYMVKKLKLGPRPYLSKEELARRNAMRKRKDYSLAAGQLSRGQVDRTNKRAVSNDTAYPLGAPETHDGLIRRYTGL